MKYTIVGDPHAKSNNRSKIATLCEIVEGLGNSVIWLGDMLDNKELIRGRCLNAWLEYFSTSELDHIVLVGNHDYFNLECLEHSLEALKLIPNVTVVDAPMEIAPNVHAIPYAHEPSKVRSMIAHMDEGSTLFGHLDLAEFDYGNGKICESGNTFDDVAKFGKVITGHFHKYQERNNVTYLGTPFSLTFGETNQDKYLGVYYTQTQALELLEMNGNFPRHLTYVVNCDEDTIPEYTFKDNDHIRVFLEGTNENILKFDHTIFPTDAKIVSRPTDSGFIDCEDLEGQSNKVQFTIWSKEIKKLEAETVALGEEILEEVGA